MRLSELVQKNILLPTLLRNMGSYATPPDWIDSDERNDEPSDRLGDVLAGRLADVEVDSVEAVREVRERR